MLKGRAWLVGIVLFLSASMGFAQVPGNPDGTPHPGAQRAAVPQSAHPKPFVGFKAIGAGTSAVVDTLTPCAGVSCTASDACECLTISGVTLTTQGLGKSTLTASINLDTSTQMNNGVGEGFCDLASGPATLTAHNGSTLTLDLTGSFCVGFSLANYVLNGGYTIVGGTGNLISAAGTGNYSITAAEVFTPTPAAMVMNGTLRKKP